MRQPQNTKELRTFLGFTQYLRKFMPNMAEVSVLLRQLLDKDLAWHWDKEQDNSFQKLRAMVSSAPVLGYYEPQKPVTLEMDASSKGLGAVLLQEGKPIVYASRPLTQTQQRYAQIEKEKLAIVHGAKKFHHLIFGKIVAVESDHRPLEHICNKPLHQAPLRLQKILLTLQSYDLRITYKPGKEMCITDALSMSYLPVPWPTTVTAKPNYSWQKQIAHGKSNLLPAKANSSRQKQIAHGKTKFAHGKTKFTHSKTKFAHSKTKFGSPKKPVY